MPIQSDLQMRKKVDKLKEQVHTLRFFVQTRKLGIHLHAEINYIKSSYVALQNSSFWLVILTILQPNVFFCNDQWTEYCILTIIPINRLPS